MKKMIALMVSIAFSLGLAGFAAAQAPAAKPAEAPKPAAKETKADCLKMAKDDAAKADCEKKFAKTKKEAAPAAPKKEEAKKP
jgi:hypothetical protein